MLGLFMKRTRGSITVMVTLMLIPTIFFTGFLTDLARIKLYSNQAVITADNYGETIIAEYDYVLKELYGLFAVTQDAEGIKALDDLQDHQQHFKRPKREPEEGFAPFTLEFETVRSSGVRRVAGSVLHEQRFFYASAYFTPSRTTEYSLMWFPPRKELVHTGQPI